MRSTGWRLGSLAMLVLASVVACGGSTQTPTTSPSPAATSSPTARPTLKPSPTPAPTLSLAGTFVATGKMAFARAGAMAVLLPNGKVLIAGGYDDVIAGGGSEYLASAELYDPSTHRFTTTGSMASARAYAGVTLLTDGKVLIVGGRGCTQTAHLSRVWCHDLALSSAEIYDPATGRFTGAGSMDQPYDAATLLPDGRVLVMGAEVKEVEVYDPSSRKFSRAGELLNKYAWPVFAALGSDGRVLVVGNTANSTVASELFDPARGMSHSIQVSAMGTDAAGNIQPLGGISVQLNDGRVLVQVFDGIQVEVQSYRLVVYDGSTQAFANAGAVETPDGWLPSGAVLLHDGRVLFSGGSARDSSRGSLGAGPAALYDPASGFNKLKETMLQARNEQTMTTLPDGTVLIAGGTDADLTSLSSAELFEP